MDILKLDLNLLVVFAAIFDERSISAVGKKLRVSQPTVSFSLKKLRHALGDELFVRTSRGMQPTARAELLNGPIRQIIETVEQKILQPEKFDAEGSNRTFSLSMSDIGELVFLPPLLKRLRVVAPNVTVRCSSMPPEKLIESMGSGEVDLAIGYFPDLKGARFYQQKLFEHPFVCLARRDHPTIGNTLSLQQFLDAEHAVVAHEGRSQEIFEKVMNRTGVTRRVRLRSAHFMSLPLIIASSDLIAIVPHAVGTASPRRSGLNCSIHLSRFPLSTSSSFGIDGCTQNRRPLGFGPWWHQFLRIGIRPLM